ncbi:MAG: hypothetical protein IKH38_03440 [Clostridia bacterium]|nr:hypothetical protein [Clostridia bacterium]
MKRELCYRHLPLRMMSKNDLKEQLRVNRGRLRCRLIIGGLLTIATLAYSPRIGLIPLVIVALTSYWLWENNRALETEIALR